MQASYKIFDLLLDPSIRNSQELQKKKKYILNVFFGLRSLFGESNLERGLWICPLKLERFYLVNFYLVPSA